MFDKFRIDFGGQVGSKIHANWSRYRSKRQSTLSSILASICHWVLLGAADTAKTLNNQIVFFRILLYRQFCLVVSLALFLDRFWMNVRPKDTSTSHPKSMKHKFNNEIKHRAILGNFLVDLGKSSVPFLIVGVLLCWFAGLLAVCLSAIWPNKPKARLRGGRRHWIRRPLHERGWACSRQPG